MTTVEKTREFSPNRRPTVERLLLPIHRLVEANVRMFQSRPIPVLLTFFVAHIFLRSLLPMPMGYDEGEQFIVTQEFALGYSSQPPLYNWLQHVFFNVFGVNTFAMILLKQLSWLAIFLTTYGLWRKIGLNVALASACTFSLFFLNEVGWELQRTRTHLALAVWMAALFSLIAFLIVRQSRSRSRATARRAVLYVALGAVFGMGLLAKYNFVAFPFGLTVAALLSKELRKTVMTPWSILALFVAALVFLPHGLWVMEHLDWVASHSKEKFGLHEASGVLQNRRLGANAFGGAVFMFFLLPIFVGTILYLDLRDWNYPSSAVFAELDENTRRFVNIIGMACALAIALIFAIVICSGITVVRSRWLVPAAFLSLGPLILRTRILLGPNTHRIYWLAVLIMMLASSVAITSVAVDGLRSSENSSNLPVLAGPIWDVVNAHPQNSAVIIEDRRLAGLIRLQHPNMRIMAPGYSPPNLQGTDYVVVIAETTENGRFGNDLEDFASAVFPERSLDGLTRLDETGKPRDDKTPWKIAGLN